MNLVLWLSVLTLVLLVGLSIAAWLAWRRIEEADRLLVKRIARLKFGSKLGLARSMFRDRRIPFFVRAIPPALVLYLALPVDIVPDFIPVLGQLDDVVVVAVGIGLLLRFTPRDVLEEHVRQLEDGRL